MTDGDEQKEVDVEIAGQKVRAKGYRLMDLLWIIVVAGAGYYLYQHDAAAQAEKQNISQSVKEANVAVVQAIRENNTATVEAIQAMTTELKKASSAQRETACLLDPAIKNKPDARDFCKRMTRNE